ncbi:hypothetical protein ACQKWADRAFT_79782 [Trichoderma austrokoningii]
MCESRQTLSTSNRRLDSRIRIRCINANYHSRLPVRARRDKSRHHPTRLKRHSSREQARCPHTGETLEQALIATLRSPASCENLGRRGRVLGLGSLVPGCMNATGLRYCTRYCTKKRAHHVLVVHPCRQVYAPQTQHVCATSGDICTMRWHAQLSIKCWTNAEVLQRWRRRLIAASRCATAFLGERWHRHDIGGWLVIDPGYGDVMSMRMTVARW